MPSASAAIAPSSGSDGRDTTSRTERGTFAARSPLEPRADRAAVVADRPRIERIQLLTAPLRPSILLFPRHRDAERILPRPGHRDLRQHLLLLRRFGPEQRARKQVFAIRPVG